MAALDSKRYKWPSAAIIVVAALTFGGVFITTPSAAGTTPPQTFSWWAVLTFDESLTPGEPLRFIYGPVNTAKACDQLRVAALETTGWGLRVIGSSCKQLLDIQKGRDYWVFYVLDPAKVKQRVLMIFLGPAPNLAECDGLKKTALRSLQSMFKSKNCIKFRLVMR